MFNNIYIYIYYYYYKKVLIFFYPRFQYEERKVNKKKEADKVK